MTTLQIPNNEEPSRPLSLVQFQTCIQLKDTQTYRQWQFQIQSTLNGFGLFPFLDGSHPCPSPTLTSDPISPATKPTIKSNPAYTTWYRQDQLILGALAGTLSPSVASLIVHAKNSHEAWTILTRTFANPSRGHILQIKDRLDSITHSDLSISEYMSAIKGCTDDLAQLGKQMDLEDIISKVLRGLDQESYKPVIHAIHARDTPISFEALHEKLINHELALKQSNPNPAFNPSAHVAHHRHYPKPSYTPRQSSYPPKSAPFVTHTTDSKSAPYRGRCHFCDNVGHVASDCRKFKTLYPDVVFPTRQQQHHPRSGRPHAHTVTHPKSSHPNSWLLDSGASHHITDDLNTLALHTPYDGPDDLIIGDGSSLSITHTGSFSISSDYNVLHFKNVLCVPNISRKLLSVSQFCHDNNAYAIFLPSSFCIKAIPTGAVLLQGNLINGTYEWSPPPPHAHLALAPAQSSWHHRLGHPSNKTLHFLNSKFNLRISKFHDCISCNLNKSKKLSFGLSTLQSHAPLDIIFSDVWTSPVPSRDSYKYYVVFVDHFSHYVWLYPLKRKSDTDLTFNRFRAIVEKFFNRPIKQFYSDNGREFTKLTPSLLDSGISHLTSPPHTPEHNGFAERRHRHIVETGLSLLTHGQLPLSLWPYAFATATYLINRLPTPTLHNQSPYFTLFNQEPNYQKLHNFGCLCFPWLRPYTAHKLEPRSIQCVFIGYSTTQSAYLCLNPLTSRVYTSRHVRFVDDTFPYANLLKLSDPPSSMTSTVWHTLTLPVPQPPALTSSTSSQPENTPAPATTSSLLPSPAPPQPPTSRPTTRLSNNIRKPNPKYTAHLTTLPTKYITPSTIKQALIDPLWRAAMLEEYEALLRNNTWTLVPPDSSKNVIGCKWVYRIKYNPDGTIKQHKARLVAKGFNQRPGLDYSETFSPVIKPTTVRLLLSLAVSYGWPLRQIDVNNAFLQGTLPDTVFMAQPPGFANPDNPTHVCKLVKAIYGLKQAPRAWYTELRNYLISYGFRNSISDSSLFIFHKNSTRLFVLVYVDDIIVTGPNSADICSFITAISSRFSLKDLGPLSYFLGVEVTPTSNGLHLNQSKYISDILTRYNMLDCRPVTTPMSPHPALTRQPDVPVQDESTYRAIVGSLQYLSLTRPDIAFPVNKLAQFLTHPTAAHWIALKRLLRFLNGTINHGLHLLKSSPFRVHAFCDADWAGDKDDYVSTTGYIVFVGRNPISWSSKKQRALSRSSTEAEFRAIADTTSEVLWLHALLSELDITPTNPPVIYCDNLGATHYSANPIFHSRMKHLALAFHFVREQVQLGTIRIQHVNGNDQLADTLTKPLHKARFTDLASKIGLTLRPTVLRERVKNISSTSTYPP